MQLSRCLFNGDQHFLEKGTSASQFQLKLIALYDGMCRSNNQATTLCGFSKMKSPWSAMLSEHGQQVTPTSLPVLSEQRLVWPSPLISTMATTFTVSPR